MLSSREMNYFELFWISDLCIFRSRNFLNYSWIIHELFWIILNYFELFWIIHELFMNYSWIYDPDGFRNDSRLLCTCVFHFFYCRWWCHVSRSLICRLLAGLVPQSFPSLSRAIALVLSPACPQWLQLSLNPSHPSLASLSFPSSPSFARVFIMSKAQSS